MKIYGDIQSGNCYKVKLVCALLDINHVKKSRYLRPV